MKKDPLSAEKASGSPLLPATTSPPHDSPATRRAFLGQVGGLTAAACTLGAAGLAAPPQANAHEDAAAGAGQRLAQAFLLRRDAAFLDRQAGLPPLSTTGDELRYASRIGNFSKGLPHNALGEVDPHAYRSLLEAIASGQPEDFENIVLGGAVKLVNPQAGLAFDMEGLDSHQFVEGRPPALASAWRAAEAVEDYWHALLRDVNFTDYATHARALQACAELSSLSAFVGPRHNGQVTPQTLFRGFTAGDVLGPYISQFLLQPINLGALPITQQFTTYLPGIDYLTDVPSWMAARNGQGPFASNSKDPLLRYLRNGRDMAAWVHVDALFQAYFHALLWLLGNGIPFNAGNPYNHSKTQAGFGTFGGPHIIALMSEISSRALKAQWFQKWFVHRVLRPEEFGGLVHWTRTGAANYPLHPDILQSQAVAEAFTQFGTFLLPQAYPEGCPQHPAYGSGHSTVAGACITMLKAFFNTDGVVFPDPVAPSADGLSLQPYNGADAAQMTLTGELHKLAANVGIGRDHAGIHWRSDY
ncbi:MAG TPA: vanadium-dependent haloperoxidase [Terriglobales bacterium]|nr:vanadium-dependent haloperoxidase [Terriglobales bacterium]